jgi:hypothetical protein
MVLEMVGKLSPEVRMMAIQVAQQPERQRKPEELVRARPPVASLTEHFLGVVNRVLDEHEHRQRSRQAAPAAVPSPTECPDPVAGKSVSPRGRGFREAEHVGRAIIIGRRSAPAIERR